MFGKRLSYFTLRTLRKIPTTSFCLPISVLYSPLQEIVFHTSKECQRSYSAIGCPTTLRYFDIREHAREKRRRRELEAAGIDPDDDNANDNDVLREMNDEENNNNDEDNGDDEEAERRRAYMEKCRRENAEKRAKFKEFRAKQIAMSQNRKAEQEMRKRNRELHRLRQSRLINEDEAQSLEEEVAQSITDTDNETAEEPATKSTTEVNKTNNID